MYKQSIKHFKVSCLLLISLSFSISAIANKAIPSNINEPGTSRLISTEDRSLKKPYSIIKMRSSILAEDRELLVHLPEDYDSSQKRYSVLYLLDGNRHFPHAVIAEDILQNESLMPQSIIVAIKNNRGTRRRDLSSGRENFLQFIKDEVFTLINNQYRTSDHKTLFGHSMAGAFTLNTLVSQADLFDNYIAASPTIQSNDSELIAKYKKLENIENESIKSLYLSFGNEIAEGKSATDALNKFLDLMKKKTVNKLTWHYSPLPKQVHMTTPYLTLYAGLSYVFSDYQAPTYSGFEDYTQRGGLQNLKEYYSKRAIKYAVSAEVPSMTMINLAFAIFGDGHESKALEILEANALSHQKSFRALNALAQAYEDIKKPSKALTIYKKAVALAEELSSRNLVFFKRHVTRLENVKLVGGTPI
ncbi:MAG: hypothetical protein HRT54_08650 [Colwellia sp.]|nr:hypothetical protein [Colwellia sp.]